MDSEFIIENKEHKNKYTLLEKIGQPGQYGYAQRCRSEHNGKFYAAKVIGKHKFRALHQRREFFEQLRNEINIMRDIHHPNIIEFKDYFENNDNLYIIMELCEGGELFDRISEKGSYCEKDAAFVLRQIVEGINYLHQNDIAHLDLKPDNFLFSERKEDSQVKIIDFGMSKIVEKHKYLSRLVGTPYYVAPEVLKGHYTKSCDIWSIGVIMFILLFGYPPFYADPNDRNSDKKIFDEIKKGFHSVTKPGFGPWFPSKIYCSDSAKQLISKMLEMDSVKRISAKEALAHPWLQGITASARKIDKCVLTRIMSFKKTCKLKQAFLNYVVDRLNDLEMKELKEEFAKLDTNRNGRISLCELKVALDQLEENIDECKAGEILKELDANNDGSISYTEWCMVAMNKKLLDKEERLMHLFNAIDVNKDGKLSKAELTNAMGEIDPDFDVEAAIQESDLDHDGNIDYKEFVHVFENMH